MACLVIQLLLFPRREPQGSDNLWKLPGGPLMVARVSPLPSTLWDSGLACRGSCPWVVLRFVPRGPAAKEGLIWSCLHSSHTPAPTPRALGLSVPKAVLTCSRRLALLSQRVLSPCWSWSVMDCCAVAMFLLSVGVCPAWSHVGATVDPPTLHRPGLVHLGAHTQLHLVLGGAGPGLHPQKCMWGYVTWGDSSCASDTFSHLKITL